MTPGTPPPVTRRPAFRQVLALGLANAASGWLRAAPLALLLGVATATGLAAGAGQFGGHLASEASRIRAGALVVVARAESGVDRAACERLTASPQVVHAGSVGVEESTVVRPGVVAPFGSVTPGMLALLMRASDPPVVRGPVMGAELAERLALPSGQADVLVIPANGPRTENQAGWLVEVDIPSGRAQECWAEFTPNAFAVAADAVTAALILNSPDLVVADVMFDSGPRSFDRTTVDRALLSAALIGMLVGAAMARQRRADLVLYRLIGFPSRDSCSAVLVDVASWSVVGVSGGLLVWLAAMSASPLPRPVVAIALTTAAAALGATLLGALLAVAASSRRRALAVAVREGG